MLDLDREWVQYTLIGAGVIALTLYVPWVITDIVIGVAR